MESRRQEKYPPISKKRYFHGYGSVENKKIPPQPSQNAIKKSLPWVWRAEDRENAREDKKESR